MLELFIKETKRFFFIFIPLTIVVFIPIYIMRKLNIREGIELFFVSLFKGYLVYIVAMFGKAFVDWRREKKDK